jgi:hypothetical protein
MLSIGGVVRKPGATVAYEITEGSLALTMADGKVTGFTASGKGRWSMGAGGAASMAGKTFTYKARPTGAGQWETDVTADVAAQ